MASLAEAHDDLEQGRNSDDSSSEEESCTAEIEKGRTSCCSSNLSEDECSVDLESGGGVVVMSCVHSGKVKKSCRICHLSFDGSNSESGFTIELGCCCKGDLAAAHRHCAEAWFKIRGNKTCEICGSTAKNVSGVNEVELMEQWNEGNESATIAAPPLHHPVETRRFWQGHRFLNFLLACMVFAFVISWLFHFNVPS